MDYHRLLYLSIGRNYQFYQMVTSGKESQNFGCCLTVESTRLIFYLQNEAKKKQYHFKAQQVEIS